MSSQRLTYLAQLLPTVFTVIYNDPGGDMSACCTYERPLWTYRVDYNAYVILYNAL